MADPTSTPAPATSAQPQQPAAPTSTQTRTPSGQFDKGNALPIEQQAAQGEPKPKAETAEARRIRLKLDANGPEEEYDESTLASFVRRGKQSAQLMSKAEARSKEADRKVREAEAKLARLKTDPFAVLRELGADPLALSEQQILRALEEEKERQLPPEERALRKKAREADELRAKLQEREQTEAQAREEAETEQYRQQLTELFTETMARTGLPKSSARAVMHRIAAVVQAAESHGEQVDPDEAAFHVMESIRAEQRAVVQGMSVPELADWLGPEMMKAIRKHDLDNYRRQKTGAAPPPPIRPQAPAPTPPAFNPRRGRWELVDKLIKGG